MYHDQDRDQIGPLAFCSFGDESKNQIMPFATTKLNILRERERLIKFVVPESSKLTGFGLRYLLSESGKTVLSSLLSPLLLSPFSFLSPHASA